MRKPIGLVNHLKINDTMVEFRDQVGPLAHLKLEADEFYFPRFVVTTAWNEREIIPSKIYKTMTHLLYLVWEYESKPKGWEDPAISAICHKLQIYMNNVYPSFDADAASCGQKIVEITNAWFAELLMNSEPNTDAYRFYAGGILAILQNRESIEAFRMRLSTDAPTIVTASDRRHLNKIADILINFGVNDISQLLSASTTLRNDADATRVA